MRPHSRRLVSRGDYPGRARSRPWLVLVACALASTGCEEEPRKDSGPIIGQRTQKVVNAAPALKQRDAKVATTKITAKDPITLQGNAYVSIIGRASQLSIEHAVNLYHAANDRCPKNYDEFMTEIIKANNIALPKLPPYQDYGYDEKEHKLIILEYPDRK